MQISSLVFIKQSILGGMVSFTNKEKRVLKWCLNRSGQLKNTYLLKDMAGVKSNDSAYLTIHPSRILRSNVIT